MRLTQIRVRGFRNLIEQTLSIPPNLSLFIGKNGQGKTNLLEAITLVATGKSSRSSLVRELIGWGQPAAEIETTIEDEVDSIKLQVSLTASGLKGTGSQGSGKRQAFLNGQPLTSLAHLLGRLLVVTFDPSDLELVRGSPVYRRNFLNRHLVDLFPQTLARLIKYQRALKHKADLLASGQANPSLLEPWNRLLAEEGTLIRSRKQELCQILSQKVPDLYNRFSSGCEKLMLQPLEESQTDDLDQDFRAAMSREIAARRCLVGPHRDQFKVLLDGRESRSFSSQGQARSIVLALKLSMIEAIEEHRGESPVILLDDVDSELDATRRALFFGMLEEKCSPGGI